MQTVIAFVAALCILIYFHEMGHYGVARLCGVKVSAFLDRLRPAAVCAGSSKWARSHRMDHLQRFRSGGYVKMLDERGADPEHDAPIDPADLPRAFNRQPVDKRFAIVAAGPAGQFLPWRWCCIVRTACRSSMRGGAHRRARRPPRQHCRGRPTGLPGPGDRVLALQADGET
ncbi:site-2 protease family protein [Cupriavidus basilensis]